MMNSRLLDRDDFQTIKQMLTAEQVIGAYWQQPNRGGFVRCPFHGKDAHPSLKVYQGMRGWHCFTCHKGGDVIQFTSDLFSMGNLDAAKKLIQDFNLPIKTDGLSKEEEEKRRRAVEYRKKLKKFQEWGLSVLNRYRILLCEASRDFSSPYFYEAIDKLDWCDYRIEDMKKNPEEYMRDRKGVQNLVRIEKRFDSWYEVD